jgi:ribosomal protein S18 acetylase RimI-like enzyme
MASSSEGSDVIDDTRLENPIWAALAGAQAHLATSMGGAQGYQPEVAPFAAVPHDGMALDAANCAKLPSEVFFLAALPTLAEGFELAPLGNVTQMVYAGPPVEDPGAVDGVEVVPLEGCDEDMVALTDAAFPGYFRRRTGIMGKYIGIRDGGRLVAMCGERMDLGTLRELSAICTHPEYRGRGYADLLMRHTMHAMQQQGVVPFLHVGAANLRAQALYESLGFIITRELKHARLKAR